jgi:cytochrome P450
MLTHPSCQDAAHQELDAFVGRGRLPDYGDCEHLPYVNAIINEVLRWNPATPMGRYLSLREIARKAESDIAVPHYTTQEEEYRGWRIPAGTVVFGNVWAILHDPLTYPDPDAFVPERFLTKTSDGLWIPNPNAPDPKSAAFGFGRRVCPGVHLADQALFAAIASVLAAFEITPVLDETGKEVRPLPQMTGGFISYVSTHASRLLSR